GKLPRRAQRGSGATLHGAAVGCRGRNAIQCPVNSIFIVAIGPFGAGCTKAPCQGGCPGAFEAHWGGCRFWNSMNTASFRKRLVMGNWKMHGGLEANAKLLADLRAGAGILADYCTLAVCAPFPYLAQVSSLLDGSAVSWGAQDVSAHEKGAYTGEVSASMLNDFACTWVLVGHSERRAM